MISKRTALVLLRVAVGLALLAFIIVRLEPRRVFAPLAELEWVAFALAVASQVVAKIVWSYRWRDILAAVGLQRGLLDLLALVLIGLFFNSFLPTAMGGDVVRGYYAARGREAMLASYLVVVIERALGMVTFAGVAAVAAVVALAAGGTPVPDRLLVIVAAGGGAIAAAGTAGFAWRGGLRRLAGSRLVARRAATLAGALEQLARPETPRLAIFASSVALKLIAILFYIACARAVGIDAPALLFFLIVPVSTVASMIPVTLNGLGLREGVFVALLAACGAPAARAGAVAVLALAISTGFALAGGLVYLFYRRQRPPAPIEG